MNHASEQSNVKFQTANTVPTFYINSSTTHAAASLSANTWGGLEGEFDQTNISLDVNGTLTQAAYTTAIGTSTQPLSLGGYATAG